MNSTTVPDQSPPGPAAPRAFVPWLTRALVVANAIVFLLTLAGGGGLLQADAQRLIEWGTNFAPLTASGEWWRLATAMFLHFGLVHLLFNMWALWVIGGLVERLYGPARFAVIYALAGVAGGLASMAWNPLANSAGASGAIFGIIGAQLAFFMRGGHLIPAEVLRAQRNSTLAFIAYAVVFGLVVPGIDNAAHFGGLATGFGLGWMLTRPLGRLLSRAQLQRGLLGAGVLAVLVLAAGVVAANWSAGRHADEQAYLLDWRRVVREEPAVLARMDRVMSGARDGKAGDAEVVAWLEEDGIPFYRGAEAALGRHRLPQDSPLAAGQGEALEFVRGRAAAMTLFAEGVRENDRDKLERASRLLAGDGKTPAGPTG
jgi:rhomboid protease GluP